MLLNSGVLQNYHLIEARVENEELNRTYGFEDYSIYAKEYTFKTSFEEDLEKQKTQNNQDDLIIHSDEDDVEINDVEMISKDYMTNYFWNEQFQIIIERPCSTPESWIKRKIDMESFFEKFKERAVPIVKVLVNEIYLPIEEKTIKPLNFGGIAGGDKFIKDQFFFKFLSKTQINLYGGEHFASKSFSHEIKSMESLLSCNISTLHFPLMMICEYRGFKVMVITKLPISSETLIWGSADGGKTIKTSKKMRPIMEEIGQHLKLAKHPVLESFTGKIKSMIGPVDIEGHLGKDGRYYCVDTARLFPPTTPVSTISGCHLYKLFRPEFMRKYVREEGLSSDAFSFFGLQNHQKYNTDVLKATNYLIDVVIPHFAGQMDERADFISQDNLKDKLHEQGINLRYLGYVLKEVKTLRSKKIILMEMCSRTIKNVLHEKMRQTKSILEHDYLQTVAEQLNQYFSGPISQSMTKLRKGNFSHPTLFSIEAKMSNKKSAWTDLLQRNIPDYFEFTRYPTYNEEGMVRRILRQLHFLTMGFRLKILKRTLFLCGITVKSESLNNYLIRAHSQRSYFSPSDIIRVDANVKLIKFSDQTDKFQSFEDQKNLYLQELKIRSDLLGKNNLQIAQVHMNLAKLCQTFHKHDLAMEHWEESISIVEKVKGRESSECLELKITFAKFLIEMLPRKAEEILLQVLNDQKNCEANDEIDIVGLLHTLAILYTSTSEFDKAEQYFDQAISNLDQTLCEKPFIMHNKAQMLFLQEKYCDAKNIYKEYLPIIKSEKGENSSYYGIALDNYAQTLSFLKKFAKAQKLLETALHIKKETMGEQHVEVGKTYCSLGSSCLLEFFDDPNRQDLLDKSKKYYKSAIRIFKALSNYHGIIYRNLATIHFNNHEPKIAYYYLKKCLKISPENSAIWLSAKKDLASENPPTQFKIYTTLSTLNNDQNTLNLSSLSEKMKLLLRSANIRKKDLQNSENFELLMNTLLDIFEENEMSPSSDLRLSQNMRFSNDIEFGNDYESPSPIFQSKFDSFEDVADMEDSEKSFDDILKFFPIQFSHQATSSRNSSSSSIGEDSHKDDHSQDDSLQLQRPMYNISSDESDPSQETSEKSKNLSKEKTDKASPGLPFYKLDFTYLSLEDCPISHDSSHESGFTTPRDDENILLDESNNYLDTHIDMINPSPLISYPLPTYVQSNPNDLSSLFKKASEVENGYVNINLDHHQYLPNSQASSDSTSEEYIGEYHKNGGNSLKKLKNGVNHRNSLDMHINPKDMFITNNTNIPSNGNLISDISPKTNNNVKIINNLDESNNNFDKSNDNGIHSKIEINTPVSRSPPRHTKSKSISTAFLSPPSDLPSSRSLSDSQADSSDDPYQSQSNDHQIITPKKKRLSDLFKAPFKKFFHKSSHPSRKTPSLHVDSYSLNEKIQDRLDNLTDKRQIKKIGRKLAERINIKTKKTLLTDEDEFK